VETGFASAVARSDEEALANTLNRAQSAEEALAQIQKNATAALAAVDHSDMSGGVVNVGANNCADGELPPPLGTAIRGHGSLGVWASRLIRRSNPETLLEPSAYEVEVMAWQKSPAFVFVQVLVVVGLWAAGTIKMKELWGYGGFDSFVPMQTTLLVYSDCTDHRSEAWRWLAYQFTHTSVSHVGINSFLLVVLGIPLEGFHGHVLIALFFNFGILGGAASFMVFHCHSAPAVGMSGGVYALLGVHFADLVLNWSMSKYRWSKIVMLFLLAGAAVIDSFGTRAASNSAHVGGFVSGLLVGVLTGRSLQVQRWEQAVRLVALATTVALMTFSVAWVAQWPPRTLWDTTPWCWSRRVYNLTSIGDVSWRCVLCQDSACIKEWARHELTYTVSISSCLEDDWAIIER